MKENVGVVWFRPAPDFDRLEAIIHENPREVIAQGKHFLAHTQPDRLTQARVYHLLCHTSACILNRSDVEAVFHGHEAVRLARGVDGVAGKATLFDGLVSAGAANERIGEYDRAIDAYREALAMPLDWLERRHHEEAVLTSLGRSLYYKGTYAEALATFDQAGQLAAKRQDPHTLGELDNLRGMCHIRMGDFEKAEYYLTQAAAATNSATRYELRGKCYTLGGMAILKMMTEQLAEAEEYASATLALATELEAPRGQVEGHMVLAFYARKQRRVRDALEQCGQASRIAFEYRNMPLIQEMSWLMGCVLRGQASTT